jgi:hypothetical protein
MDKKYNCENCNFHCNEKIRWEKHIETEKHTNGKRKIRSDYEGPYNCNICNFTTKNKIKFTEHKLNNHSNKEERKREFKFYCELCDKGYFYNDMYTRHINTEKHKLCVLLVNK